MTTADGFVIGTTQIFGAAPRDRAFNVVLLAEGFTNDEQYIFNYACTEFINTLRGTAPFDRLSSAINIFRVNVSSTDSGADDPVAAGGTGAAPRTYFDASFGKDDLRRLMECNTTTALQVAAAEVPEFTVAIVVVNSAIQGGAGGAVAMYSLAADASEIAIHEIGHNAFGLADEYAYYKGGNETGRDYHPPGEPSEPNVTTNSDRNTLFPLKWRLLIEPTTAVPTTSNSDCSKVDSQSSPVPAGTVGLFEGAHYYHCKAYRPEFDCKMRTLGVPFCRVCQRVIFDKLAHLHFSISGISSGGNNLYQLHRSGLIWKYTGTPCSGDICPGWQKLDNRWPTRGIAADGNNLYQLHMDGAIWKYTGTPCSGNSCPGWQKLDNNPATIAIAAGGNNLYQLHMDGAIWKYTGTPCSGNSCPGWQKLDNNIATVAIAADASGNLYQLHTDGSIWKYTGTPCSGNSCPGWQRLDNKPTTIAIAVAGNNLYQLQMGGLIWKYTGTPCSGDNCPGWQKLDNDPDILSIAAGANNLYKLHRSGLIWKYTGTPCSGNSCPGWQKLDNNPATVAIAADGSGNLYQLHRSGSIWKYTGTPCSGNSCPGWQKLDNNPATATISSGTAYIMPYTESNY